MAGHPASQSKQISLFLCGDVMTGRGIDQIFPHPSAPRIYEPYVSDATDYVDLAERTTGPIPRPVDFAYIWGDALEGLTEQDPDARIINLETSITISDDYWRGKGISYRMHPANIRCLTEAKIDCCVLANNHVLDWGYAGLEETLKSLKSVKIKTAGAGLNSQEAQVPAVMETSGKGRVVVFSLGDQTSGIPMEWGAGEGKPGVDLLEDLGESTVGHIAKRVQAVKQPGDIVVFSIHWGGNWGYPIPPQQTRFAHQLIDVAGIDILHGHSSHHPKGIEVYKEKPIIYGCGDFLDDYEGITGYEAYRDDLGLMYFVTMDTATRQLIRFEMEPTQIRHFRVNRASREDSHWLTEILDRESRRFGTRVKLKDDQHLILQWEKELDR